MGRQLSRLRANRATGVGIAPMTSDEKQTRLDEIRARQIAIATRIEDMDTRSPTPTADKSRVVVWDEYGGVQRSLVHGLLWSLCYSVVQHLWGRQWR